MARGVNGMWPDGAGAAVTDDLLDLRAHGLERDAERLERLRGDALTLVDQAEQDVLGPDVVVVEQARFFLRQDDHSAGSVGEAFEHGWDPPLVQSDGRPHLGVYGSVHRRERTSPRSCTSPAVQADRHAELPVGKWSNHRPAWRLFPLLRSVGA